MFVMSFVGMALSIGLHVDIGIVVRSLADKLALARTSELPLPVNRHLMTLLGSKVGHPQTNIFDIFDRYYSPWWTQQDAPTALLFGPKTAVACLKMHRQVQQDAGVFRSPYSHSNPARVQSGTAGNDLPAGPDRFRCSACLLSRHAAACMQSDLLQIKGFATTQETITATNSEQSRRIMAAAHCFREEFLRKVASAEQAGTHRPLDLSEAEVVALKPFAPISIPSATFAITTATTASASPMDNVATNSNAGTHALPDNLGNAATVPIPPAGYEDDSAGAEEMFSSGSDGNESTSAADMFASSGSDEEIPSSLPDAPKSQSKTVPSAPGSKDVAAPSGIDVRPDDGPEDARGMFGDTTSGDESDDDSSGNMFSSGDEGNGHMSSSGNEAADMFSSPVESDDSGDADMFDSSEEAGDEAGDNSATDMFVDGALLPGNPQLPPHSRFPPAYFAGLEDSLFEDAAGEVLD